MFCDKLIFIIFKYKELKAERPLSLNEYVLFKIKFTFILSLFFIFTIACTPQVVIQKEPLKENGEIILYFQPVAQGAERLSFTIDAISAVRNDGAVFPLDLSFNIIEGNGLTGSQRLFASGVLPQGEYSGIFLKTGRASVKGEEGPSALLVSEEPVTVSHLFQVARGKASTLFLTFDTSTFTAQDVIFTPLYRLETYGKELYNLTGYITGTNSNIISIFNKKTMLNVGAIATGRAPMGMVFDRGRGRSYIAYSGDDVITVLDISSGEITDRVTLNFGDEPMDLALTPDGSMLVSANRGSNTISIIDADALYEIRRISVGEEPTSVVIDPLGLRAFIANSMSTSISVVGISSGVLAATIDVEGTPLKGAFNRDGTELYVIHLDTPYVTVVDPSSLTVSGKIFIDTGAISIEVDTRTDLIFVGNSIGSEISVIDPSSSMLIDKIKTGGPVSYMTLDDEENMLFALIPDKKILQKVNLTSKKIIGQIDTGEGPYAVVVVGER